MSKTVPPSPTKNKLTMKEAFANSVALKIKKGLVHK
jgi:hypothetical protein